MAKCYVCGYDDKGTCSAHCCKQILSPKVAKTQKEINEDLEARIVKLEAMIKRIY